MYNNSYGYGVYKRSQINIGNPYKMKPRQKKPVIEEEAYNEAVSVLDADKELKISQDIIHKAKEEAAQLIRNAELEAENLLKKAKEEIENLRAETEQTAKEEGYKTGEELAQQHYSHLISEAQEIKEKCKEEYENTMSALESDIVELVLDIASKIVGDEIKNNEEAILSIVRNTINACTNREHVTLKVSDKDYDVVVQNKDRIISMVGSIEELNIKMDKNLDKGACIVETGFGSVDGSFNTRLEDIKQAFYDLLGDAER
ncbi:MAG: hypothetical protein GX957_06640 [Clostridiaceae bacterium]|nr:hypothetical protein [Clostridiaceae bacterium]